MKLFLFLVSVTSLFGGYIAFGREYGVAYFSRSPEFSIYEELAFGAEAIRLPYSARGIRELFEVCGDVRQGVIYALQSQEVQQVIDGKCLAWALAALDRNPTYSAAHTIKMMSSTQPQEIRDSMVLSQKTSAYESWDAKLRLAKSIDLFGTGGGDFDAAVQDDIRFLVQSDRGRAWLANLYQRIPLVRDVLARTIDARPAAEKADFLQKVRAGG